jgi:hypothetical protein
MLTTNWWTPNNGKQQSSQWMSPSSPHPKRSGWVRLNLTEMVDCFLCQSEDSSHGVHSRPCCKSTVLHRGTKMFGEGCQGKITHTNGMLGTGYDLITCPNLFLNIQTFITEKLWQWSPKLYSLNLALSCFFLFPVTKNQLQGRPLKGTVETAAL